MGDLKQVTNAKGKFIGWVDRRGEGMGEDEEIVVELPCGHKERFWLMGLTDLQYIKRTKYLKKLTP